MGGPILSDGLGVVVSVVDCGDGSTASGCIESFDLAELSVLAESVEEDSLDFPFEAESCSEEVLSSVDPDAFGERGDGWGVMTWFKCSMASDICDSAWATKSAA